jgi:hypothetical protein
MRVVVNEFMSLDGVVQAPGGAEEDTDGGFRHGGWSAPYFDLDVIGPRRLLRLVRRAAEDRCFGDTRNDSRLTGCLIPDRASSPAGAGRDPLLPLRSGRPPGRARTDESNH